ncbi:DHH family phosphoesterase [Pseudothermotoga thermarum]|uniref:Phosphoesterase RecJ domain protein n=1 Tax=Pseudothermotoga thermarum DSM 5069 TaxID=688269 RepID=F7YYI8_9THEM|nr:bifunctional oligoribonuclease/PAP phosphatase NrnA [Pseudothermotoga thermarum]AEH51017.1 phosphoesterase RecJ domain protein [Pseudothermotoga thermarum DSM 5069]
MIKFSSLISKLTDSQRILIVGHIMPDGDDISSVVSLTLGLQQLGKSVLGAIDDKIPPEYLVFPGVKDLIDYEKFLDLKFSPDVVVVLDCSSPDRVGRFVKILPEHTIVVIDHHATNGFFGDINWVDSTYAATAQMVFHLNKVLGIEYNEELATINFVGLATDSGFFRYSNTTSNLLKDAAELVEMGAKPHFVASTILENKTLNQFLLLSKMIDKIKVEKGLAYSVLTFEDYLSCGCTDQDSSGFVSEIRSLKNVEVAVLVMEYPKNRVHVSLRSKNYVDVSKIAATLGGGGHARAAGCSFENADPWQVLKEVLTLVREAMGG